MERLFRLFLLKERYDWDHETTLVEYLTQHPDLRGRRGLETVPDQSTLWRSWHHRFTAALRGAVERQREPSSSKRRTRVSQCHENQNDRAAVAVVRIRNQIPMTRPY
nr:transposase [Natrinema gari]